MSDALADRRVVLLHGLARSSRSMSPLRRALLAHGAQVLNLGYRSRHADISTLASEVGERIAAWEPHHRIDVVTHSLGGLVVRAAVAQGILPVRRVRRVVMLAPPNGGSELADRLPAVPLLGAMYARVTGPAGRQLGTGLGSFAAQLPPVEFDVGIIAGTWSWNPIFSRLLGGPNDGKVRVERTKVAGMRDFITISQWHPLMMMDRRVIKETLHFLETGRFQQERLQDGAVAPDEHE